MAVCKRKGDLCRTCVLCSRRLSRNGRPHAQLYVTPLLHNTARLLTQLLHDIKAILRNSPFPFPTTSRCYTTPALHSVPSIHNTSLLHSTQIAAHTEILLLQNTTLP